MQMRRADAADEAVLTRIRREAIRSLAVPALSMEQAEHWATRPAADRVARAIREHEVWMAVDGATLGWVEIDGDRVAALYVSPAWGRRGIGSALLARAEASIRDAGHASARLESSENALGFYLRRAYVRCGSPDADGAWPLRKNLQGPGKIILLNGASSAGKSTLARALQQQLPEPFLHWSFDHLRESSALPMARIRNGELDWASMRAAVFDGFHRSLPAFAAAGNNLIVDHIIEQAQWLADLVELLAPFDVFFVGVHCPLPELERREQQRGDRRPGEARRDFQALPRFTEYDLAIDATQPIDSNVARLITAWHARSRPMAFERMVTYRGSAARRAGW
jgi:chloramphenicol 3-O phosphotransferase